MPLRCGQCLQQQDHVSTEWPSSQNYHVLLGRMGAGPTGGGSENLICCRVQSACLKLRMEKQLPSNKQAQILRGHGEPDCQTPRGAIAALQGAKGIRARHLQRHPSQASVSLRGAQGHLCSTIPMGHAYQRPAGGLEGEQGRSKLTALGLEEGAQRSCLLLYAFEISHN